MTARHLATIVLRILGALWALGSLFALPGMLALAPQADAQTRRILMSNGVAQLVWLALGMLLFLYAERVAQWMFAGDEQLSVSATAGRFSLLAIYFAIPALAQIVAFIYRMRHNAPKGDSSFLRQQRSVRILAAAPRQKRDRAVTISGTSTASGRPSFAQCARLRC